MQRDNFSAARIMQNLNTSYTRPRPPLHPRRTRQQPDVWLATFVSSLPTLGQLQYQNMARYGIVPQYGWEILYTIGLKKDLVYEYHLAQIVSSLSTAQQTELDNNPAASASTINAKYKAIITTMTTQMKALYKLFRVASRAIWTSVNAASGTAQALYVACTNVNVPASNAQLQSLSAIMTTATKGLNIPPLSFPDGTAFFV